MKVTINAFIVYHHSAWMDKPEYIISWSDMACLGAEYALVRQQDIEVEIPDDFDPNPVMIKNLRAKQTEIRAEAEAKVTNIEEQIQRLLCIEAPKEFQ